MSATTETSLWCAAPGCTRTPHAGSRRGLCLTCHQERQDDLESPRDITDWQRYNRGGVVRWIKPRSAA